MFLKWTGGLLILFAGSGMGVWLAWGYKKRLSTLENLRRMIYCLKGEIVYSHAPLEEAFERIGKREKGVLGELFTQTAEKIGCHNGENIFQNLGTDNRRNGKKWKITVSGKRGQGKTPFFRGTAGLSDTQMPRRERYFCIWNSWNFLFQDSAERSGKNAGSVQS